jgi:YidC/Oxa1 family membrane protein insertase
MKLSRLLIIAAIALLAWSFISPKEKQDTLDDVVLKTDNSIAIGKDVVIEIQNHAESPVTLPANCPKNPLLVEEYLNGEWAVREAETNPENCTGEIITIQPGKTYSLNYAPWNQELFNEIGKYRVTLNTALEGKEKSYSQEITVTKPNIVSVLWREIFYKPILNTLIFLIASLGGHSLGWGIILLTLLIKLILLVPNHKALRAQKQMQKVQPQLDALKVKHKDNPQKLAEETMQIWKKYKVNPMSSCLPMLIQFPILIALFYVVKGGLNFINPDLLYAGLKSFDPGMINTLFLGIIDLAKVNVIALPIIIGLLQFGQMRLTFSKTMKNQPAGGANPMPMMNQTMMYVMPVMIAVFTASLPAAVGFYWGTSTLFGIVQQVFVNRSKD